MSLSQRSRSAIYAGLKDLVDEEAVEEMLSHFPVRDLDEPVTQGFVRAEIADVRAEIADVRVEIAELRAEMHQGFQRMMLVTLTTTVALGAALIAAFSAT